MFVNIFHIFLHKHIDVISFIRFNTSIFYDMDPTRISTQVSVKHCSLCQGDTEYYCYDCQQDLCIQCKKLHIIDLSTKHHFVTSYTEKRIYPPKPVKQDPKQIISARPQDHDNHESCVMPFTEYKLKSIPPV